MPEEPQMTVLSPRKRQIMFWLLCLVFVLALPTLIFYTSGNRINFATEHTQIVSVGGIYLSSDIDQPEVYVDNEPVDNRRLFRQAIYIEDVPAGVHAIHTQAEGVTTWVKEIPVMAHFVTEVTSFNVPVVPEIRLITPYVTATGTAVVNASSSFATVATTNDVYATTTTATTTFAVNPEFTFVETLFASSSEDRALMVEMASFDFTIATTATSSDFTKEVPTTTVMFRDVVLRDINGEVQAQWQGGVDDQPYYYCVEYTSASSTRAMYGDHVYDQVYAQFSSTTDLTASSTDATRLCRSSVRIDRLDQEVLWFDFVPNSRDLVLMHLNDGLYMVEIDDRAWQNTQLLYDGDDLHVLRNGNQILVRDGNTYLEVFTELQS